MISGKFPAFVFYAVLCVGVFATVLGLSLPSSIQASQIKYLIWLSILVFFIYGLARASRRSTVWIGCTVVLVVALLSGNLWPLFVVVWFAASSLLLGRLVLMKLQVNQMNIDPVTAFLVGAGIFATTVGLLAHFNVNYVGVYGVLLALPLFSGWRFALDQFRCLITRVSIKNSRADLLAAAIVSITLFHFCIALLPEVGFDALAVHLFVPSHLASRHQWGFNPDIYSWALMPMLADWMYSIGYMLAGETAARLINVGFVVVMALLGRELVIWAGGSETGAKWAALLFLSTPLTYTETNSLFIESIWAAYMVAGTLWLVRYVTSRSEAGDALKLSGLVFGLSAAAKAVTFVNLPVFVLLLLYRWRDLLSRKSSVSVTIALVLFLVLGMIPYITAWVVSGNPVFPFYNEIFKSPFYPVVNFDNTLFKSGVQWDLTYRMLFDSGKYLEASNGASGFQWLILLLPALIILIAQKSHKGVLLFVIGVSLVVFTFQTQSYMRYIFPSFLILSAMLGVALSNNDTYGKLSKVLTLTAIITFGLNLLFITSGTWAYRSFPENVLWSDKARDQYLEERLPIRRAVEFINYVNSPHTPVAMFSQPFGAGLNADALYPNWYNYRFNNAIKAVDDASSLAGVLSGYASYNVLLDSSWGTEEKRKIIEESTNKIAEFGSISVRSVKPEYLFKRELLKNPDLSSQDGWSLAPGAEYDPVAKTMRVTVASNATQIVNVRGNTRYLNSVTARCVNEPSQGRVQVNWLDENGQFVSSDNSIFDCAPTWSEHSIEIFSPSKAVAAVVYVTAHTHAPLEFNINSFRQ